MTRPNIHKPLNQVATVGDIIWFEHKQKNYRIRKFFKRTEGSSDCFTQLIESDKHGFPKQGAVNWNTNTLFNRLEDRVVSNIKKY